VSQVDRRQKGGDVDDLLDALPAMVKQLLAGEVKDVGAPVAAAAPAPVKAAKTPPGGAEIPLPAAEIPAEPQVFTDGKGAYVAWVKGSLDVLFAGDGKKWFKQRVAGGGRSGDDQDLVFWEPRAGSGWRRSFEGKGGVFTLRCGDAEIPFTPVAPAEAARMRAAARWYAPRWQRALHALARDDQGTYFLVDQAREGKGTPPRLFVGRKASMEPAEVVDAIVDAGGTLLVTPTGRLRITWPGDRGGQGHAAWLEGQATTELTWLDVQDHAPMVYGESSAYRGEPLGTPCDGRF
jgi:hypothetical protein